MSAARSFTLPDLGEGLTEAEVVAWLVSVGDAVSVDQPVAEVETAKASVEVTCPCAGTVAELHGAAGDTIAVGAPLVTVTVAQTTVPGPQEGSELVGGNGAAHQDTGSGAVHVGFGTGPGTPATRRRTRGTGGPPASTETGGPLTPSDTSGPGPTSVVSPLVKRLAREHGIDVARVRGTGEDGLVLRRDVEASAAARTPGPVPGAEHGEHRSDDPPGTHRTPLRGTRRVAARHLARSHREIPAGPGGPVRRVGSGPLSGAERALRLRVGGGAALRRRASGLRRADTARSGGARGARRAPADRP